MISFLKILCSILTASIFLGTTQWAPRRAQAPRSGPSSERKAPRQRSGSGVENPSRPGRRPQHLQYYIESIFIYYHTIAIRLGIFELPHANLQKNLQPRRADAPRSGALQKSTGVAIFLWVKWGCEKMTQKNKYHPKKKAPCQWKRPALAKMALHQRKCSAAKKDGVWGKPFPQRNRKV
jgi:hypothetical protein